MAGIDLFFRVKDYEPLQADKSLKVQQYGAGDVVIWKAEGWGWGSVELTHPEHRILRIANMTVSEAEALVSQELNVGKVKLHTWKRIRKFDLNSILIVSGKFKDFLDDDTRIVPIFKFTGNISLITSITTTKDNADTVVAVI